MKYFKQILLTVLLSGLLAACTLMGLNINRNNPNQPKPYPAFTEADTLRGKVSKYRAAFDVYFYELDLAIDIKKRYVSGSVAIFFEALAVLDTLQLDLYHNMKINKIVYGKDTLSYERKYNAVFIYLESKVAKGEQGKLTVFYEGKPAKALRPPWKGGFVWKKDRNGKPWIGVACETEGASLWWPLKDHLHDEPDSLTMHITIPKGLFCVGNGRLMARKIQGEQETFTWKTGYPINTYNVTFYIGDFVHFSLPYHKADTSHQLDFYVLPYHLKNAQKHFKQVRGMIAFFEYKFGTYPWWNDGYKLVESPYAGMEHQTAIAFGDKYRNQLGRSSDYIILHETAHEWWGNSVSAGDFAEIWLHEGFATYSEALYVEHTKGYAAYLDYLGFYALFIKNKRPLVGPYDVGYWTHKDTDVYTKGALVLHTLRNLIADDSLFFDIIESFYQGNKYSIARTTDFIDLVHRKTGNDYSWFFEQYLFNRLCPQLEWNYTGQHGQQPLQVKYRWVYVNERFALPVILSIDNQEFKIYPSRKVQTLELDRGGAVYWNINNSYISLKRNRAL